MNRGGKVGEPGIADEKAIWGAGPRPGRNAELGKLAAHDLRGTRAKRRGKTHGDLVQMQWFPGRPSLQTSEPYLAPDSGFTGNVFLPLDPTWLRHKGQFSMWEHSLAYRKRLLLGLALLLLPIFSFCVILQMEAVNMPLLDDYPAVLNFLNVLIRLNGSRAKTAYIFTAQHNEYKLIFEHAIFAAQYYIIGHVNFLFLMALGNSFVLLILLVLWKMFVFPGCQPGERLLLFTPVPFFLIQLHYAETLDWSMAGLQNLPVIFFALLAILLLTRDTAASFWWAVLALAFSAASSGNGFLVAPIGFGILFQSRRFVRLISWCIGTLAMAALYFYHYDFLAAQTPRSGSVLDSLRHIHLLYAFVFLGSAFAPLRYLLAALTCLCFVAALRTGYRFTHPAVFYSMVWIFLTAIGLSGIRSGFGVQQSLSSRYTIYSDLLLIFCFMFLTSRFRSTPRLTPYKTNAFIACLLCSMILAVWSDLDGYRILSARKAQVVQGMMRWEQETLNGKVRASRTVLTGPPIARFYDHAQETLTQSIDLGLYRPPYD